MDDSGNAFECVGEIAPDKVLDDDDVDLIPVLGVCLSQRISLSRPRDSNGMSTTAINWGMVDFLTLERGSPLSRDVPKRVHRCSRTLQ